MTHNGGVNLTAAGPSPLRPLMLPARSMLAAPVHVAGAAAAGYAGGVRQPGESGPHGDVYRPAR
jgi:hypothetical protein